MGHLFRGGVTDLALGQNDQLFIAGGTDSQTGVATIGTFDDAIPVNADKTYYYMVKMDAAGYPIWGTYYGPDNEEDDSPTPSICVDSQNNVYLAGRTTDQSGYYATPGVHQETNPSQNGEFSGFIAKFLSEGQRLWGTYYGGEATDWIWSTAIDENDNFYGAGITLSQNAGTIGTPGSYLESSNGSLSTFVFKMNSAGQRLWGSYVDIDPMNVPVLQNSQMFHLLYIHGDHLYFSYETENDQNIATEGAYQNDLQGNSDGYVLKFDLDGALLWGPITAAKMKIPWSLCWRTRTRSILGGALLVTREWPLLVHFKKILRKTPMSVLEQMGFWPSLCPRTWVFQLQFHKNNGHFGPIQIRVISTSAQMYYRGNYN